MGGRGLYVDWYSDNYSCELHVHPWVNMYIELLDSGLPVSK